MLTRWVLPLLVIAAVLAVAAVSTLVGSGTFTGQGGADKPASKAAAGLGAAAALAGAGCITAFVLYRLQLRDDRLAAARNSSYYSAPSTTACRSKYLNGY